MLVLTRRASRLGLLLVDCQDGVLAIKQVGDLILCLKAEPDGGHGGMGGIKLKVDRTAEYLQEPFAKVAAAN